MRLDRRSGFACAGGRGNLMMNFETFRTAGMLLRLKKLSTVLGNAAHSRNILKLIVLGLMLVMSVMAPGPVGRSYAQNPLPVFDDSWDGFHSFLTYNPVG